MTRAFGKLLRIVLWALVAGLLVITAIAAALVATERGTRFAVEQIVRAIPGTSLARIDGTLWHGITLTGLDHDDGAGTRIAVGFARIAVAWPALIAQQLHVREIALRGTRIELPESEPDSDEPRPVDLDALVPDLPLALRVDSVRIDDLVFLPHPDADAIVLEHLHAGARADATRIEFSEFSLSLTAPLAATLQATASLDTTEPRTLTVRANGAAELDQDRLVWSLESTGPPERLLTRGQLDWQATTRADAHAEFEIEHTFDGAHIRVLDAELLEGRTTVSGTLDWTDGVQWDLVVAARDVQLTGFVEQADGPLGFDLSTRGRLAPDGTLRHETRVQDAAASFAGVGITGIDADLAGDLESAEIRSLSLSILGGTLTADGTAAWGNEIRWQLAAEALGLDPGLLAEAASGSLSFRLDSEGALDPAGALTHQSRLIDLRGELATVTFDGLGVRVGGDLQHIRIDELAGRILGATLRGEADVRVGETIGWDAQFTLDDADLAQMAAHVEPAIIGTIGFDLESRGELRDGQPFFDARLERLRGEIEGQTLAGSIHAQVAGDVVRLDPAQISLGRNRVQVSGTVTPPFDLRYEIDLPSLSALPLPETLAATGRISGSGEVRGTAAAPDVDARLSGRGIAYGDFRLDRIEAEAHARADTLDVSARLERLEAAGQEVALLELAASGLLDAHRLTLGATTDFGRVQLVLDGGLRDAAWSGRLLSLDLQGTPAGDWTLEAPAQLEASAAGFALAQACVAEQRRDSPRGRLCATASRSGTAPTRATLDASLPLALAREALPPTLTLPGTLAIQARASLGEQITADAVITLPDNHILASGITDEPLRIEYRDTRVHVQVLDDQLDAQVSAQFPGYLSLDGQLRARLDEEQALGGTFGLNMPDLSWLAAFTPALADLAGTVRAEIELAGTLSAPTPSGTLRLERFAVTVPDTGVAYRHGEVDLSIDAAQQLTLKGRLAGLQRGTLQLSGEGSLAELPQWRASLNLDGQDLPLLRTPELDVDMSPEIVVTADHNGANVRGRVVLPLVEARVQALPEGSVGESPDLVLADATEDTARAYPVRTDIEILLGERVSLEGMGFSTGLAGQIRLRGDEAAPIAAFGELDLRDGRYMAYGQDLRIDHGRLTFNGPLDDPGLDVRASRTVGSYQAGLEIRGTLTNPRSQVFSVPALPESDALSLLLTGRLLSAGTSGADAALLVNALAGLGVSRGDEIMRDIGSRIGFDELGLDTDEGFQGTRLTVGKRLSSRLLVRYAVGVFDGVGRFITEYNINRHLDLEISSSTEAQGGDLIYRIER